MSTTTSTASTHTGSLSVPNSAGMIIVPRPTYSAAVAQRVAASQQNRVAQGPPNITIKRAQSGGTEIRLIVANQKDAQRPVFAAAQNVGSVRQCDTASSCNNGIKVDLASGTGSASATRTMQSFAITGTSATSSLSSQPSTLQLLAPVKSKGTGNVVNGAVWNALSVVDAKSAREPASATSEFVIQIRPEQFKQLVGKQTFINWF